ncbi:MAG: hypothetical protein K5783_06685 [Nitrosopumilus sp.]|nr:hypothetical protein [Nitrosopumilus sp.]
MGIITSTFYADDVFAQPLQEVNADVIEFDGVFATVEISWNDNGASYYEVGCVSCMPNLSDTTTENLMVLSNVTAFANGDALLYVIAYDDNSEITTATQVVVKLR